MEKKLNYISERLPLPDEEWKIVRGNWFHLDTKNFMVWMKREKCISLSRVTISNALNKNTATMYLWKCIGDYIIYKKKPNE